MKMARDYGSQYLGDWDALSKVLTPDEMWKINERFLDIQIAFGRDIYISHDPKYMEVMDQLSQKSYNH